MNSNEKLPKTPQEYRLETQLTSKGLSSDFPAFLSYKMQFATIALLVSTPGKESTVNSLFDNIVKGLRNTPTYSERYLNATELEKAAEYGVKKGDLINSNTELVIKRLDEMALRLRQIGAEIVLENYKNFEQELSKLYEEARSLIK